MIITEPFYANYNGFAIANGVKVVPIASDISDNFALPPIETFESYITPRTRAILLCNPGNPTGYLYSQEEIRQLSDLKTYTGNAGDQSKALVSEIREQISHSS